MKIAVIGYYGFSNFGDDLFIVAANEGAALYWKEHDLMFVSPEVKGVQGSFMVPKWFPKKLYASTTVFGRISRLYFLILAIFKADLILNAGGSTISSLSSVKKFKLQLIGKKFLGIKIAGIGLSVGPFASAAEKITAADFLKEFEYLSLRDAASCREAAQLLLQNSVTCSRDLVGIITQKYQFKKVESAEKTIGVSLCRYESLFGGDVEDEKQRIECAIRSTVDFARAEGYRVKVFTLNSHPVFGDKEVSKKLIAVLKDRSIPYDYYDLEIGTDTIMTHIAACSMMVTMRLHGAIAAYMAEVPFFLFEYHKKCTDFLDDVDFSVDKRAGEKCSEQLYHFMTDPQKPDLEPEAYRKRALLNFTKAPWISVSIVGEFE